MLFPGEDAGCVHTHACTCTHRHRRKGGGVQVSPASLTLGKPIGLLSPWSQYREEDQRKTEIDAPR